MRKKKWFHLLVECILCVLLVAFDQWTKYYATIHLKNRVDIPIIRGVLELHYLENRGAAFGILQDQNLFFLLIGIVAVFVCAYLLWKVPVKKKYVWMQLFVVFLCSGAIGNMIDRIRLQYVVDFIYITAVRFPVFNVADIYVTISSIGLVFLLLFVYKESDFAFIGFKAKRYRELEDQD